MLEPGSGSGIGNNAIIIRAKQQSQMEKYGVVHEDQIRSSSRVYLSFKDNDAHEHKARQSRFIFSHHPLLQFGCGRAVIIHCVACTMASKLARKMQTSWARIYTFTGR